MIFMILIGALMFAEFVNITTMPNDLKALVERFNVSPIWVVAAICAIYVILGTAMEELSMILLTIPVFFPVVVHLGFDPVWFGILIVVVVEIGLISPPVGHEPLRAEDADSRGEHGHRVPRRDAVHDRGRDPARDPGRVPDHLPLAAIDDEMTGQEHRQEERKSNELFEKGVQVRRDLYAGLSIRGFRA